MIHTVLFQKNAAAYRYECERLLRSYILPQKLEICTDTTPPEDEYVEFYSDGVNIRVTVKDNKVYQQSAVQENPAEQENTLCALLYRCMEQYSGVSLKWGILTGVRPVKYIRRLYAEKGDNAERYITENLLVSREKLELANRINNVQQPVINNLAPDKISLYVSIPFCPSRCSYCSFISEADSAVKKLDSYFELLLRELDCFKQIINDYHLKLETIYVGGGTPTILDEDKLEMLVARLNSFNSAYLREFTVEAGRPDTVNIQKLEILKAGGVQRISINPQSMNDNVLSAVGRHHTVNDIYSAFDTARKVGFDCINSDIIAGLPCEIPESFAVSLERLIQLAPENLTVHTLSLKRSSTLYRSFGDDIGKYTAQMVDTAADMMNNAGYIPYYMYRQKNAAESLENIGYTKPGSHSLYNIYIMEEMQTILAAGCAASTKLVGSDIRRLINFKYPFEYIERFDEVLQAKNEISDYFRLQKWN